MVEKYTCLKDFPAYPESRTHGAPSLRHGPFVLATDYAALEAERDEWKRRCEVTEEIMHHYFQAEHEYRMQKRGMRKHWSQTLAENLIAEGRDNG